MLNLIQHLLVLEIAESVPISWNKRRRSNLFAWLAKNDVKFEIEK